MIISYIGLDPFLLVINLYAMSFSNVFSNLIYVFGYRDNIVLNQ